MEHGDIFSRDKTICNGPSKREKKLDHLKERKISEVRSIRGITGRRSVGVRLLFVHVPGKKRHGVAQTRDR